MVRVKAKRTAEKDAQKKKNKETREFTSYEHVCVSCSNSTLQSTHDFPALPHFPSGPRQGAADGVELLLQRFGEVIGLEIHVQPRQRRPCGRSQTVRVFTRAQTGHCCDWRGSVCCSGG